MVGFLTYAAAGAAVGLGEGIAEQSRKRFEAMRDELQRDHQIKRDEADRTFQGERDEANRTFWSGESAINRTFQGERDEANRTFLSTEREVAESRRSDRFQAADGAWFERPKGGGEARPIVGPDGNPVVGKLPRNPNELTQQQRLMAVSRAKKDATTKDKYKKETTDWEAFTENLIIAGVEIDEPIRRQIERGLREQIERQVSVDAGERTSLWRSESAEFEGGTRAQWEKAETDRRLAERLGEIGIGGAGAASGQPAGAPPGERSAGTRENPYKPATQAEFDALPAGAIFINPKDGLPYRKK